MSITTPPTKPKLRRPNPNSHQRAYYFQNNPASKTSRSLRTKKDILLANTYLQRLSKQDATAQGRSEIDRIALY